VFDSVDAEVAEFRQHVRPAEPHRSPNFQVRDAPPPHPVVNCSGRTAEPRCYRTFRKEPVDLLDSPSAVFGILLHIRIKADAISVILRIVSPTREAVAILSNQVRPFYASVRFLVTRVRLIAAVVVSFLRCFFA
jgi:hypothetical protein